jgi:hypothetical protein
MRNHRATLDPMGQHDPTERMLGFLCDVVLEQGGDWTAVEVILRRELDGDDLQLALGYSIVLLIQYTEPGGIEFLRGMRDRRRRLVPVDPAPRRWPFRAVG